MHSALCEKVGLIDTPKGCQLELIDTPRGCQLEPIGTPKGCQLELIDTPPFLGSLCPCQCLIKKGGEGRGKGEGKWAGKSA